jgi:hypothetical protein
MREVTEENYCKTSSNKTKIISMKTRAGGLSQSTAVVKMLTTNTNRTMSRAE